MINRITYIGLIILLAAVLFPTELLAQGEGQLFSDSFWVRMFTVNNGGRHNMQNPYYKLRCCVGDFGENAMQSTNFQAVSGFCPQSYWFLTDGVIISVMYPDIVIGNSLTPPAPNPTTTPVTLGFAVKEGDVGNIRIYDVGGRLVRNLVQRVSGPYSQAITWKLDDDHGRPVAAGVYFARLETRSKKITRQIVLLGR